MWVMIYLKCKVRGKGVSLLKLEISQHAGYRQALGHAYAKHALSMVKKMNNGYIVCENNCCDESTMEFARISSQAGNGYCFDFSDLDYRKSLIRLKNQIQENQQDFKDCAAAASYYHMLATKPTGTRRLKPGETVQQTDWMYISGHWSSYVYQTHGKQVEPVVKIGIHHKDGLVTTQNYYPAFYARGKG